MKKIVKLNNRSQWEQLLSETGSTAEIIIFKSSPYCGTSAMCEKIFDEWFNNLNEKYNVVCVKIDVIEARPLSTYIADEFGIKHESPQAIWIDKNGKVKWHNSHFAITETALSDLLN